MAKNIKGITIELGAETKGLDKALEGINKSSRNIQKELREVDKLLKFNPKSTELVAQKQKLLSQQVSTTKEKLDKLRDAEKQVQAQFEKGEIGEEQYRAFQREIVSTESKLDHYNNKLKEVSDTKVSFSEKMQNVGKKLSGIGTKMSDVGKNMSKKITAPAIAAGGALIALATKSGNAADRIIDLSDITGMSTDSIQEWQHVATVAGVSTEAMTSAVEGLVKKIPQLESEGGKATESLGKLGLTFDDLKQMTPDEQMDTMITRLSKMEDPLERNAIGAQLFGGSWKDLAPILGMGSESIAKTKEEAHELGRVMSEDSLNDANNFRVSMDKLKGTLDSATNQIGAKLAPVLTNTLIPAIEQRVIPAILKFVEKIGEIINWFTNLDASTKKIIGVIAGIVVTLGPVILILGKFAVAISGIISVATKLGPVISALKPILAALSGPAGWIAAAIAIGVLLYKNWDVIKEKAGQLKNWIGEKFSAMKNKVVDTFTNMKDSAKTKLNEFKSNVVNPVKQTSSDVQGKISELKRNSINRINELKDNAKTKFNQFKSNVVNPVTETASNVKNKINSMKTDAINKFESLRSSARSKFDAVKSAIVDPINSAKNKISSAIEKIKGFFSGLKLKFPKISMPKLPKFGLSGKFSLNPPSVPKLKVNWNAEGAIFKKPTIFNTPSGLQGFGEAGPEVALPLKKLSGILADTLSKMNLNNESVSSVNNTVEHTGTIKVQGINNKNELIGVKEIIMDELRREVRT